MTTIPTADGIRIPASKWKGAGIFILALLFMALSTWLAVFAKEVWEIKLVGYIGMAFSLLGIGAVSSAFFSNRVYIEVTPVSFTVSGAWGKPIIVEWADVSGFSEFEINRNKMLVVHVADNEKYLAQLSPMMQKIAKANIGLVGSPVLVSAGIYQCTHAELKEFMLACFEKYGNHSATLAQ